MAEFQLQAGTGKAEILFKQEDFPLKAFTGIHDSIHVRVLLLKADISIALVSVELTSLPPEAIRRFRQECSGICGIDEEHIFISVTHTFSAPHIPPQVKTEQEQRLSEILYDRILTALRSAAEEARHGLRGASAEYCQASCCLNVNRNAATPDGYWIGRNEDVFSDHTVRVLKLRHEGELFACLINYDIQSSVMDQSEAAAGGRLISGDLAGAACRELEKEPGITALFLPGCAGDQAPILRAVQTAPDGAVTDLHEEGFMLAEQLGQYLAERIAAARPIGEIRDSGENEKARISLLSDTAFLPEQEMKYPTKELRPHLTYSFDLTGNQIPVPVTLVRLGPVRLLMTTPELNSGFGTKLRKLAGEQLMIGTLINGGVKYLPEAEDYQYITYEAMNSKLGPGSAEIFLETFSRLSTAEKYMSAQAHK